MKDNYNDDLNEQDNFEDNYFDAEDDLFNTDNILDDIVKDTQPRKRRKTPEEFYVKGADLINEIKKYQDSKKEDAVSRNVPYEER